MPDTNEYLGTDLLLIFDLGHKALVLVPCLKSGDFLVTIISHIERQNNPFGGRPRRSRLIHQ
jgi:hypothetical protein